ncbi:MAG: Holliday junction DNA helicase RuvA [Clostridiales bacterium GWE2_32_10]|nr:MAG: Holliday junction DNA helicase RuvA [Clostridiales bacterium GWE2_32_10]HBY20111.1 Holliday junction resolvase RuvX [Clostridiales bacterium]
MKRVMGLDYGEKTIGVAVSDLLMFTAQGVEIIRRDNPVDLSKSMVRLKELIEMYEVDKIVLGFPKNMNNTVGERGEKTQKFKEKLEKDLGLDVILIDERLTTMQAEKMLIQADVSRQKRKKVIDKMAAVLILQAYLDQSTNNK